MNIKFIIFQSSFQSGGLNVGLDFHLLKAEILSPTLNLLGRENCCLSVKVRNDETSID